MKVLHVINSMQPGGAEILLTNSLSPGGLCEHVENHLAYFMAPSYLLNKLDKKVILHCLDYKGAKDVLRLISKLRKIITDNNIDIVHSHLNPADVYTHLACPPKVPQVHTMHTTYSMDKEMSAIKLFIEKYFYLVKRDTNLIFLSEYAKKDFEACIKFKGRSFVLNNFVSDEFFSNAPATVSPPFQQLRLIAIGSLKPLKNFEYLLQVFEHLKGYNISLDIYGNGNQEHYQRKINESGLPVRMMGHCEQLNAVIGSYDAFIMPSKFEGFPLSVFEAMASGIPLLLSDIPPLRSVVKEHAVYFKLDDAEATARMLIAVLKGETEITERAAKARIYANELVRRETYITRLLKIYGDLVS